MYNHPPPASLQIPSYPDRKRFHKSAHVFYPDLDLIGIAIIMIYLPCDTCYHSFGLLDLLVPWCSGRIHILSSQQSGNIHSNPLNFAYDWSRPKYVSQASGIIFIECAPPLTKPDTAQAACTWLGSDSPTPAREGKNKTKAKARWKTPLHRWSFVHPPLIVLTMEGDLQY